jgi:hypothetical protein
MVGLWHGYLFAKEALQEALYLYLAKLQDLIYLALEPINVNLGIKNILLLSNLF